MRAFNLKYVLLLVAIAFALSAFWYYWGSARAPRGQPPLTSLARGNLDQFRRQFNDASDRTRLVLLLSPT
jgi:hypothetical protein